MKKRILPLTLALLLLCGCGLGGRPAPAPDPTPQPDRGADKLTWVHGFYASSSYSQLERVEELDAVSLGWGRLQVDQEGAPWVNSTGQDGNLWVIPEGSELVTDYLKEKNIPFNLCVFAINGSNRTYTVNGQDCSALEYALSDGAREGTAAALAEAAAGYGGLTVDFEGLQDRAGARENFPALLRAVRERLAPGQTLYAAVPPDDWYTGYDYRAIGQVCDRVILMAHSYYRSSFREEEVGGPVPDSPPAAADNVAWSIRRALDGETGMTDPGKLALAISFDTVGGHVDGEGNLLETTLYRPGTVKLAGRLQQPEAETGWSERYKTPWVTYQTEDGEWYKIWYEDGRSAAAKIEGALGEGVTGLSLWRLGTVPDREDIPDYDVWRAIAQKR